MNIYPLDDGRYLLENEHGGTFIIDWDTAVELGALALNDEELTLERDRAGLAAAVRGFAVSPRFYVGYSDEVPAIIEYIRELFPEEAEE